MKLPFTLGRLLFGGFFLYNGINHFLHYKTLPNMLYQAFRFRVAVLVLRFAHRRDAPAFFLAFVPSGVPPRSSPSSPVFSADARLLE